MWVYELFWADNFGRLSFNIDLIGAFGALLTPWLMAYLQKSRESAAQAYIIVLIYLLILSGVVGSAYWILANYLLAGGLDSIEDFNVFIALRALSLIVITLTTLNYSVLAQAGHGLYIFLFQLCAVSATLGLYYIFSDYGLYSSLVYVGVVLLLLELAIMKMTFNMAKKHLGITRFWRRVLEFKYLNEFKGYSRIVFPETGTVLSVVACTFLISSSAYITLQEHYEFYRLPLAFMTASWIVASKVTTLLVSFSKTDAVAFSMQNYMYTIRYTWYIPVLLLLIYVALFYQRLNYLICINVVVAMLYFPAMAAVIAMGGSLRVQNRNALLLKANLAMLCFYFIPVVALIYLRFIGAGGLIHAIGVSYLVRIMVINWLGIRELRRDGALI
ncbi:hypothetical protein D3C85_999140 [compost metagenome]